MKTMAKCFLLIAILSALTLANFHFFLFDLFNGYSWGALFTFIGTVAGVWSINFLYIQAKRIEQTMKNEIATLYFYTFLNIAQKVMMQCDGKETSETKEKTDEVASDK